MTIVMNMVDMIYTTRTRGMMTEIGDIRLIEMITIHIELHEEFCK